MSTEFELDGYLRPIYEKYVVVCNLLLSLILLSFHEYLNVPAFWAYLCVFFFVAYAIRRLRQALAIRAYQQGLTKIEPFKLSTDRLPHSSKRTWIGRGFEWTGKHTQRVYDSKKENIKKHYAPTALFTWIRNNELKIEVGESSNWLRAKVANITSRYKWGPFANPWSPLPPVGGMSVFHAVGMEDETDQHMGLDERNGHMAVIGTTRVGKSRLLEILVTQDLERNDGIVAVFDPKGDQELLARMWAEAKRCGRDDEFYIFSLGATKISCKYNAVANFSRIASIAGRISDELPGGGNSSAFKDFAWRFLLLTTNALIQMGEKPTFTSIKKYIEDLEPLFLRLAKFELDREYPQWRDEFRDLSKPKMKKNAKGELVEVKLKAGSLSGRGHETIILDKILTDFYERNPHKINAILESLRVSMKTDQGYYGKITASLLPLLQKLTSGNVASIISPDYGDVKDNRPMITWSKLIQRKAVLYAGFDAMTDAVVADSVGSQFFSDFVSSVSGEVYKHGVNKGLPDARNNEVIPLWIHMDEFQSLIRGGDSILSILNRSAGSGGRVTAYMQSTTDVEEAMGDKAKAQVVLSNFNSIIMLRTSTEESAKYLTNKVAEVDVYALQVKGSVSDTGKVLKDDGAGDNDHELFKTSFSAGVVKEGREPLITPSMIMSLPKGQAFAFLNGARLVKLRFPLLDDSKGFEVADSEQVYDEIMRKYRLGPYTGRN
ncbi:hypothetical protein A6E01_20700 (plasmid) [Vibrio breoganii]|uniref:TraD/TraG TraM recognition site domain-containing protein n=1 Tax=Vibrio breoganii TaxID=553239 RepID=A0AAN0Y021_9VIBR|nr:conjugative transfer system coupling protein TraD [Vibrio breoganii]ANO35633.1 hypothetical protein A6E01_20700 [Vibrio breoganii]PML19299.1 hypothetical protein BCT84_18670 [Vibrio breoganii]